MAQWKKTGGSLKAAWIGLMLFGVLAGSMVLSGCGGEAEDEGDTNAAPAKDAGDTD